MIVKYIYMNNEYSKCESNVDKNQFYPYKKKIINFIMQFLFSYSLTLPCLSYCNIFIL